MLEKLKDKMIVSDLKAKEFRLVINKCWDIYGDDETRNCIKPNEEENENYLDTMFVDVITLSQYFQQGPRYWDFGNGTLLSGFERYFLSKSISNLVEQ